MFPTASVRPSGLTAALRIGGVVRADDADRGRAAEQRAEQVAARPHRVVERDALAGEQERAVELVVEQRAGTESLGLGRRRLGARVAALLERDRRPRPPQATSSAATPARTARSRRCERSLAARLSARNSRSAALRSASWVARPVQRRGQPRAAVELAAVAAAGVPLARGVAEVMVQAPALGVLLEPAAQPRPLAQQRLVRDLDLARR